MSKTAKDYTGKAPIYQQWAEKEFVFDTMHLHWQARLLYRALLQAAWHLSTRPDLPVDDSQLQNILGVPPDVWEQHRAAVRAMFTLDADAGVLWQKRLRTDWSVIANYRQKQKELAERRWKETSNDDTEEAEQSQGISEGTCQGIAKPIPAKLSEAKRSEGTNRPHQPGKTLAGVGGSDGSVFITYPSDEEPKARTKDAGREKLNPWREQLQTAVLKTAASIDRTDDGGYGVVFQTPLPAQVFDWVERAAARHGCTAEQAGQVVLNWLERRSFAGLKNPNEVWNRMSNEIVGFEIQELGSERKS